MNKVGVRVQINGYMETGLYTLNRKGAFTRLDRDEDTDNNTHFLETQAKHLHDLARDRGEAVNQTSPSGLNLNFKVSDDQLATTGLRYDANKPRYDLIPPEFMEALAIHFAQGSKKYEDRNWEKGMNWTTCFRAMMSHAWKWFRGETYDIDPAMPGYRAPHMISVAWNALALYTYEIRQIGKDNRVTPVQEKTESLPYGM